MRVRHQFVGSWSACARAEAHSEGGLEVRDAASVAKAFCFLLRVLGGVCGSALHQCGAQCSARQFDAEAAAGQSKKILEKMGEKWGFRIIFNCFFSNFLTHCQKNFYSMNSINFNCLQFYVKCSLIRPTSSSYSAWTFLAPFLILFAPVHQRVKKLVQ